MYEAPITHKSNREKSVVRADLERLNAELEELQYDLADSPRGRGEANAARKKLKAEEKALQVKITELRYELGGSTVHTQV